MPEDEGPVWRGSRLHVTLNVRNAQAGLRPSPSAPSRPVARINLRLVAHLLLHQHLFTQRRTVRKSYNVNISKRYDVSYDPMTYLNMVFLIGSYSSHIAVSSFPFQKFLNKSLTSNGFSKCPLQMSVGSGYCLSSSKPLARLPKMLIVAKIV